MGHGSWVVIVEFPVLSHLSSIARDGPIDGASLGQDGVAIDSAENNIYDQPGASPIQRTPSEPQYHQQGVSDCQAA